MPSSRRSSVSAPTVQPVQPAPPVRGNPQSRLGNAALLERLRGTPAGAAARSGMARLREVFDLDAQDVGELAGATEVGLGQASAGDTMLADAGGVASPGVTPAAGDVAPAGDVTPAAPGVTPAAPGAGGTTPAAASTKVKPVAGSMAAGVYDKHAASVQGRSTEVTPGQAADLAAFVANWNTNKARYEAVAAKAGVPAPLVAAIHWRESTGDFGTYLHQGDPLGKKATHVPKDIPLFTVWEDAAVHALTMSDKKKVRDDLGMNEKTQDSAALATYAEFYNGLGYDMRDKPSPYVYSGTDHYEKGKFTSDGVYSNNTKDQQLGVLKMMDVIGGADTDISDAPAKGATGWDAIVAGRTLKRGARGPLVKELQARLAKAGFPCGDDSAFGPTVEKAVREFQKAQGLTEDGVVGKDVGGRLADPKPTADPAKPPVDPAKPAVDPAKPAAPAPAVT